MAKVSKVAVGQTPSEELVKQAAGEYQITDARGRRITLKKPGVLGQFRLVKILGESAQNQVYVGMVLPLIFVSEIDGEPVHFPQSEREVDALIQRLDEDGITAVMNGVQEHFGQADPEADKTAIKK